MASVTCRLTAKNRDQLRISSGTLRSFRIWDYLTCLLTDWLSALTCTRLPVRWNRCLALALTLSEDAQGVSVSTGGRRLCRWDRAVCRHRQSWQLARQHAALEHQPSADCDGMVSESGVEKSFPPRSRTWRRICPFNETQAGKLQTKYSVNCIVRKQTNKWNTSDRIILNILLTILTIKYYPPTLLDILNQHQWCA